MRTESNAGSLQAVPVERPQARKKIVVLAGEASGDLQGARLVQALWKLDPSVEVVAMGGARMREAGIRVVEDTTWGFIGFWAAVFQLPAMWRLFCRVRRFILREKPDLLVLIDSPGFNMRVATFARQHGIPTVYYFPPSAWSPRPERARQMTDLVGGVVATFEYTAEIYRKAGLPVAYFGHPLVDTFVPAGTREEVCQRLGLAQDHRFVGLLPGSRAEEVHRLCPVMLQAASRLAGKMPGLHFLLPVARAPLADAVRRMVQRYAPSLDVTVLDGKALEVMSVSDLLIMCSGSASLEAAILGTPMILLYRLATPDWWLAHMLLKDFTFMGLPNLILQQGFIPELIQHDACPERVEQEALALLSDEARRQQMKDNLSEVKKQLGPPGVVDRVAHFIWETVSNGPGRGHHHQ